MRLFCQLLALTLAASLAGCAGGRSFEHVSSAPESGAATAQSAEGGGERLAAASLGRFEDASLKSADVTPGSAADPNAPTVVLPERKIIRNAELHIEHDEPTEAQHKLTSVAESHGGYVVTSDSQMSGAGAGQPSVTVEMRVPASRFDSAVAEIRALGGRVRAVKTTGRDVTEEYIDLEARLRAQRALEAQFLEIMKRAEKVSDALEVQTQLAAVRGEIERVEGRRRFLENQSALSTIKVTLHGPAPLVSAETTGFFGGIRQAFGEGLDVAAMIVLGLIRVGVALLPVLVIFGVPLALLWRVLRRRFPRRPRAAETVQPAA